MKTVRVRIAVVVNDRGQWGASGLYSESDESQVEQVRCWFDNEEPATENVHFVEADIPLPEAVTIEGVVVMPDVPEVEEKQT